MTAESTSSQLPEERQFRAVWIGCCIAAVLFIAAFVATTIIMASRHLGLVDAGWYEAWGSWAGGAATSAAFLIAAFSIRVSSAHEHADRAEAARIRADNDMAQAKLLVIYKVERPDSIQSLATFRIENRSRDFFFDVTVPFVDSPTSSGNGVERRTADLVAAENRLHEFIPTGELLTAYRMNTEHEIWFTLVTVHTADWQRVTFAVEYTDAGGRRWRQQLGGTIERVFTTEAIPVREADRFQPRQQIRRMSDLEARRRGGMFARHLPPLEHDEQFLEVLGRRVVATWTGIKRTDRPVTQSPSDNPGEVNIEVAYKPAAPPFWKDHFTAKLKENGFSEHRGYSRGDDYESKTLRCPEDQAANADALVDEAIDHANRQFEANELAAARRALARRQPGRRPPEEPST